MTDSVFKLAPLNERRLVTFALIAYNQERYIGEAIEGALAQMYEPLEIILSDDCSTDNTFVIMERMALDYKGPHKIILNKNTTNLGIGAHINRVMDISTGVWIIAAAGDDISLPNRTTEIMKTVLLNMETNPMSVWSDAHVITEAGCHTDQRIAYLGFDYTIETIIKNIKPVRGSTHAWNRDIFQIFGPLNNKVLFEDNAISFRSFLAGSILFVDKKLVKYRIHSDSVSNKKITELEKYYRHYKIEIQSGVIGILQRLIDLQVYENLKLFKPKIDYDKAKKMLLHEYKIFLLKIKVFDNFPKILSFSLMRFAHKRWFYRYLFDALKTRFLK